MDTGKVNILVDLTLPVGATITEFSTDGTLAGNSDDAVPTEQAVKTYVDTEISGISLTEVNDLETDGANGILSTEIPIGTGADTVNYKSLSGDVTMDNAGVVSVSDLSLAGQAAEDFAIFDGTNWVAKGGLEKINVDSFNRDMTLATGTQAITGLGFKPSSIICVSAKSSATLNFYSIGFTDGTTEKDHRILDTSGTWSPGTTLISLVQTGSIAQIGTLSSLDSNGFTIAWEKVGSPAAGTGVVNFIAFR